MDDFEGIINTHYARKVIQNCPGLRSSARNGPVFVYRAMADGTPGKFLRIEPEVFLVRIKGKMKVRGAM